MSGKHELVFRIKNYKQENAELKLNPEAHKLINRMGALKIQAEKSGKPVNPMEHCNYAEIAFLNAINSAYISLGAGAEAQDKVELGADPDMNKEVEVPEGAEITPDTKPGKLEIVK